MKAFTRYVVVARHGERLDYVSRDSGVNWTAQADRPYDPPLTDHGLQQAEKLGKHLAKELERLEIPPISSIYTSPFLRCRQTSLAARKGLVAAEAKTSAAAPPPPPVRVEYGLSESFNEQWFRSWSLPGADGTWGFRINGNTTIDAETLHPWAKQPVQNLPLFTDWKDECNAAAVVGDDDAVGGGLDLTYEPQTTIPNAYSFDPWNLETREQQCARMKQVVETVSSSSTIMLEPSGDNNQAQQEPTTVLLTSHGAPVTHLYEELTGESWQKHGKSVYCCYSIYKSVVTNDGTATKWEPVVVNESKYLKEVLKGDSYITDDPKPTK